MICEQLSEGGFRVIYPFGKMGPAQSDLSRSSQIWHTNLTFRVTGVQCGSGFCGRGTDGLFCLF